MCDICKNAKNLEAHGFEVVHGDPGELHVLRGITGYKALFSGEGDSEPTTGFFLGIHLRKANSGEEVDTPKIILEEADLAATVDALVRAGNDTFGIGFTLRLFELSKTWQEACNCGQDHSEIAAKVNELFEAAKSGLIKEPPTGQYL